MKVLADLHHVDLYDSLVRLFERRLGWELYRPHGIEWFHEDFWNVHPSIDTARQYLVSNDQIAQDPKDGTLQITGWGPFTHRGITLAAAKELKFDIVLSSMLGHFPRYERFRQQYCPQAKHIFQNGNPGWTMPAGTKNLLNSTSYTPPADVNTVRYHQEFDLGLYCPTPCPNPRSIASLLHHNQYHFQNKLYDLEQRLRSRGWVVHEYGAGNRDGVCNPNTAAAIKDHGFIWHVKKHGDGFGYNVHHSFACGRPLIIDSHEFKDAFPPYTYAGVTCDEQLPMLLCINGSTAIDVAQQSVAKIADRLEAAANDYEHWTNRVSDRFRHVVDFDREFGEIRRFLENLL